MIGKRKRDKKTENIMEESSPGRMDMADIEEVSRQNNRPAGQWLHHEDFAYLFTSQCHI